MKKFFVMLLLGILFLSFAPLADAANAATNSKANHIMKYICKGDFDNFFINSDEIQKELSLIEKFNPKALQKDKKSVLYNNAKKSSETGCFNSCGQLQTPKQYYDIRERISSNDCSNIKLNDTKKFNEITAYYFIINKVIIQIDMTKNGLFYRGAVIQ